MLPTADSVLEESQRNAMKEHPVPAYGRTRCYWALLDAELRYLYLDPTCHSHMGDQAPAVISTCLLDYVHPDEQHSARADLRNVLDSRTLHGSVTRVRFARLSRIRAILGCAAPDPFPDAHIVTEDEHYIACDVVINWVSDNVVLCFLHAIIDKGKADNDELHKTEWTNWCGTSAMTTDHASELHDRLQNLVPPSHGPPDRIFQILINQPARPILFSWPPEGYTAGDFGKLVHRMQIGGKGENQRNDDSAKTSCTRRYKATQQVADAETLKEVESIFIPHGAVIFACHKVMSSRRHSDSAHNGRSNVSDMYSYQSRPHQSSQYLPGAHQPLVQAHYDEDVRRRASDGDYPPAGVPESPEYARSRAATTGYQRGPAEYAGSQYGAQPGMRDVGYTQGGNYGHQYSSSYPMQERNGSYQPTQQHPTDSRNPQNRADDWGYSQPPPPGSQPPAQQWPASSKPPAANANGPAYDSQSWMVAQGWNPGPVEQPPSHQQVGYSYQNQPFGPPQLPPPPQTQPPSPPPPYARDVPITQPPPPPRPDPSQTNRDSSPEETTTIPRVHAPPKRKRDTEAKKDAADKDGLTRPSPPGKDVITRERGHSAGASASRVGGGPPPGVTQCSSCKSETSPEWRKGPSGKKDLCNACGLRYARSKQKKDGLSVTKRRRDKEIPLAPAPAPPSAPRHTASLPSLSAAAGSNPNVGAPAWPNVGSGGRQSKRARSGTITTVSQSPSPPRSEALAQPEHYPNAYDPQYGQNVYQNGYQNGYDEYGRMGGSVPSYMPPQGRGQAQAFAGQ